MRVCWLVSDDMGGGVVSLALSCARQAAADGHEATLLLVYPSTGWLAGEECGGVTVDSLALDPPGAATPASLLRWLEQHPQDVLLFNNCDEAEPVIPYLPPELCVVYAVHDTARRYWSHAIKHQQDLDGIVPVSQVVADRFTDRWTKSETLRVVYGGSFFPAAPPPAERPLSLYFCGGDNPAKGTGDLMALWKRLACDGQEHELHWFGDVTPAFEARVRQLPHADRIHLYGRCSRGELFDHAAGCRVALILSRVEALGMAMIEAMGMGCVPVVWDIATGLPEVITHGKTGFLVPLGDYDALTQAVQQAMEMQPTMCGAVMRRAREDFGEATMWRNYAAFLDELLQRPRVTRSGKGSAPPEYRPPRRYYQLLPASWRTAIRTAVGRFPRLGYLVRDCRGW